MHYYLFASSCGLQILPFLKVLKWQFFFFSRKLNFNDYTCISKSFFNISKFNYSCSFHLLLLCIRRPFFPTYRETEGLVLLQKWELLERLLGPLVKEKGKNWHDSPVFCSWILTQNNNNKQQWQQKSQPATKEKITSFKILKLF